MMCYYFRIAEEILGCDCADVFVYCLFVPRNLPQIWTSESVGLRPPENECPFSLPNRNILNCEIGMCSIHLFLFMYYLC